MKRTLFLIFAFLLSFSTLFLFASCGGNGDDNSGSADGSSRSSEPEESEPTDPVEVPNGLAVYMPSERPIKIAQFADLHFGIEGNNYHNDKVERTKAYMKYVVDTEKPDLIVCTGDNILATGVEKLKEFVELMESFETPWTFIYGNHDAESTAAGYTKRELSEYLESCEAEYLLYEAGYVEEDANRYGNFSISVLNEKGTKLLGSLIFFDAGTYDYGAKDYESITKGQISWYETEIDKLDALYTGEGVMPSIIFSHIQLPEYYNAYKSALSGNGAKFIIKQELSEYDIEEIKAGGPVNENTGLFDAMKSKGSTVAYLCGHAHTFNFQVELDGIVLGFGPQSGFSTLFVDNDMPRQSYIYSLNKDFTFTTSSCFEDGSKLGLTFCGTHDDTAEYDEASGTYSVSLNFNYGNTILLAYNGERLTTENTTISGDFRIASATEYKSGFYCPDGKTLIFDGITARKCTFVYDPAAGTLTVTMEALDVDPEAPTSATFKTQNSDAGADAIALWTEAGTKLKYVNDAVNGDDNWIGGGWRYYVVVDGEGRIAYAVLYPPNGYGGPMGTGYYTHFVYSDDYRSNPAIVALDGFADDWAAGGNGYKKFEIVVPEGGFAFTAHGTACYTIIDMLSQGMVDNYDAANVNTRSIFNNNIRVSYDVNAKTISITTVED